MMKWQERSFAGKIFRPGPKCFLSSDKKIFAIITSWGANSLSEKEVFEELESQYNDFSDYEEKTMFVPKMMSLSSIENNIRSSIIQVNQNIYNKINKEEYTQGFELFFAVIKEEVCTFIQIGRPFILLDRKKLTLLGQSGGWFLPKPAAENNLTHYAPLPCQLLGMYEDISCHPMRCKLSIGDRLIFLNRHLIPTTWFSTEQNQRTLDHLSQITADDSPETPFWLSFACISDEGYFSQ